MEPLSLRFVGGGGPNDLSSVGLGRRGIGHFMEDIESDAYGGNFVNQERAAVVDLAYFTAARMSAEISEYTTKSLRTIVSLVIIADKVETHLASLKYKTFDTESPSSYTQRNDLDEFFGDIRY